MSRKAKIILVLIPTFIVAFILIIYLLLANYYRSGFSYGTWINGVYCTGKGIDEINLELKNKYESEPLRIRDPQGNEWEISPEDIGYDIDFTDYLYDIYMSQNPYLWVENLFNVVPKTSIVPDFSYDEDSLNRILEGLDFVKSNLKDPGHKVEIRSSDEGFVLFDDNTERIDLDKLKNSAKEALYTTKELNVDETYFYTESYTDKELKLIKEWDKAATYFTPRITLDMGDEQVLVDKSILSRFVALGEDGFFVHDEDGSLKINDEEIRHFTDEFLTPYDTYVSPRRYVTHTGEEVEINKVMYGTLTDHDDMYEFLRGSVKADEKTTYTPKYLKTAYHRGLNDIGPTYIEIDLSKQVLYFFKEGELKMEADVVTGKPSTPTPSMVCFIASKSRDVTLRGENYASPVKYWMPIFPSAGIGLHDASWQSAFGGDRYLTHGSHGCVNMKKSDIGILFDEIEVGTPVILY